MPLAAQNDFLHKCEGLPVRFDAELWAVERRAEKFWVQVADLVADEDFFVEVEATSHPWLAVARKGTCVVVEGFILKLGLARGPNLGNVTLRLKEKGSRPITA